MIPMEIVQVTDGAPLEHVRTLFQEYWDSFNFTPCFQNFEHELAGLPGAYTPPSGRLALALADGRPAGCVALRRFDQSRVEAKRLYVRPEFRGRGIGRALLAWIVQEARSERYTQIVCDTLPVMSQALGMYLRAGFLETEPYTSEPAENAIYLCLNV